MIKRLKKKEVRRQCGMFFAVLVLIMAIPVISALFQRNWGTIETKAAVNNVVIRFWDSDASVYYGDLRIKVGVGEKAVLPEVPAVSGYRSLGWSTSKNATSASYLPGKTVLVTKNVSLYAVRSKIPHSKISFYTNKGTQTTKFKALAKSVETGSYVTLPALPKMTGYQPVGWAAAPKAKTAKYAVGKRFRLTKNRKFYAVYRKSSYYSIDFYSYSGKSNTVFKKLKKSIEEGKTLKLPALPAANGYVAIGWSPTVNSSAKIYKAGTKISVKKNMKFYAVYKRAVTLSLLQNNGTDYKTFVLSKGSYYTLPSVANTEKSVFLGWDTLPGKQTDPSYEAGEQILLQGDMKLYAVRMSRSREANLTASDLMAAGNWRNQYKQIVFVGDSRTVRMQRTLRNEFGEDSALLRNIYFVAKEGEGLSWLQGEGYEGLMKIVNQTAEQPSNPGTDPEIDPSLNPGEDLPSDPSEEPVLPSDDPEPQAEKPTAVIFNLGVNDLLQVSGFVSYMEEIAPELVNNNCRLFFMSVNPVNSKTMSNFDLQNGTAYSRASKSRTETTVREFNRIMRSGLHSYTYIDTYTTLMRNGYSTLAKNGDDVTKDDGLHYSTKTYKRIFQYVQGFLSAA